MLLFLMVIEDAESRDLLEQIYRAYHKEMYYIANNILNNSHDAADVVQTSIIKLIPYIDKTNDVQCNKTKYLIVTIVKNTSIDLYRKKNNHPMLELEVAEDIPDFNTESMEDIIIRLGDAKMLAEKRAQLSPEYADVLTLKYYFEFEDKEIAEILKITHTNVRVKLSRAKSQLRNLMKEDESYSQELRMCANEGK
ncbi:RNA polymerase sigma factor [Acetoanaerobium sticklandii]|uniref:RNA polymerase sigma factor n=1 Tax=Acetoanaerobium sticklandii TaxID=1511 RepID=UPI003A957C66